MGCSGIPCDLRDWLSSLIKKFQREGLKGGWLPFLLFEKVGGKGFLLIYQKKSRKANGKTSNFSVKVIK